MKSKFKLFLAVLAAVAAATATAQDKAEFTVTDRGPHHRTLQRSVEEVRPDGSVVPRVSSVVELETGMHYFDENQWKDTSEEIEIVNGSAVARRGPHKVIFDANLHSAGAIDLESPDGKRFRSHILGLAYLDAATGKSVMFAEVKDCLGAVLPPNQVWYQDAFDGDCVADVRFTYTKAGFEQDIVFRVAPPSPAAYGLPPETTHIAVFTEFPEAPAAEVKSIVLRQENDPARRQQMLEPDVIDQSLDFGVMKIGSGQAFPLDDPDLFSGASTPTFKSWERIEGRLFLLERVEYSVVLPYLQRLPQTAAVKRPRDIIERARDQRLLARLIPAAPKSERTQWRDKQYAQIDMARPGFVLDYQTLNGSLTNYCFKTDTTYVIRGNVSLYQTTIIEGGTVVKFTNSVSPRIELNGPVDCRTDRYRPAIFTAKDDNTVGETAPGSTGVPSGVYAFYALHAKDTTATYDFHDIRIRYATYGFPFSGKKMNLSHVQVGNVTRAVAFLALPEITYRNFLFFDATTALLATSAATNRMEHGTFHRIGSFISVTNSAYATYLTNCLLISVTNDFVYAGGANVQTSASDTGIFQTVGAGARYLATNSPYRDSGTANINPTLAAELKKRTTYPPILLTGYLTTDTTLSPQAQRDTDTPDLGYHYDPLDYAASVIAVSNATLTLQAGTALGTYSTGSGTYGVSLWEGSRFISTGTPDHPNRIVAYNTVQEQANTNWSGIVPSVISYWASMTVQPQTRFRFTEWSRPAQDGAHYFGYAASGGTNDVIDCQFHGGQIWIPRPKFNFTNCLFNRVGTTLDDDFGTYTLSPIFQNVTFNGGGLGLLHYSADTWKFRDNLFDNTAISQDGILDHDYNAYTTNSTRLTNNAANDKLVTVTNIAFEKGPLGYFYLPTNLTSHTALFNNGSTWATNLGLYHFTAVTNQTKEAATKVDFGFHYVAVTNGVPFDTDGDGIGDYLEDTNGNGSLDSGETNPNDANDWGLRVLITRPRSGSNVP